MINSTMNSDVNNSTQLKGIGMKSILLSVILGMSILFTGCVEKKQTLTQAMETVKSQDGIQDNPVTLEELKAQKDSFWQSIRLSDEEVVEMNMAQRVILGKNDLLTKDADWKVIKELTIAGHEYTSKLKNMDVLTESMESAAEQAEQDVAAAVAREEAKAQEAIKAEKVKYTQKPKEVTTAIDAGAPEGWADKFVPPGYGFMLAKRSTDGKFNLYGNANGEFYIVLETDNYEIRELDDCSVDTYNPPVTKIGKKKVEYSVSFVCPATSFEINIGHNNSDKLAVVEIKDILNRTKTYKSTNI